MKKSFSVFLLSFILVLIFMSCGEESPESYEQIINGECSDNGEVKNRNIDECKYEDSCDRLGSHNITWQECTDNKWALQKDIKSCEEREVDAECNELPATGFESMTERERLEIDEAELPLRGTLPIDKDISNLFPPVKSQGSQGSCVSWAAGYYIKSYQERLEKNGNYSTLEDVMSPAFIYNYHHKGDSSCKNSGMRLITAAKILKEKGISTWSDLPYDQNICSDGPDDSVLQKARTNRIDSFKRTHISNFKTFLASNTPILIGVDIYPNFHSCFKHSPCMSDYTASGSVFKTLKGSPDGGHAVVVVGYSDIKKAYKIINSWGTHWGDNGFMWISYPLFSKILKRHGSLGYILVDKIDDPCKNVDCGSNGKCESTAQKIPYCICDSGYKPEDLSCTECKPLSYKQCKDGDIFWFNSCGIAENPANSCIGDSRCKNISSVDAECTTTCSSHEKSGCHDGDIYWFDSCGNREDVAKSCSENARCKLSGGMAECYCDTGYAMDGDECVAVDSTVSIDSDGNYSEDSASHKEWQSLLALNCRKGAGTNNSVVTVLGKNEKIESLNNYKYDSSSNIWFKFKNAGGKECYVRARDVYIEPITSGECQAKTKKGCYNQDLYWFDSCGNREDIAKTCTEHTICGVENGTADCYCETGYEVDGNGTCQQKETEVSYDSYGNYSEESASHREWESLVSLNCRSGAGTDSSVVTVLGKNEKIESLNDYKYDSDNNIWFKFKNSSGKECYTRAKNSYIKPVTSTGCTSKANKGCDSDKELFWFDSCGNREELIKSCGENSTCSVKDDAADCYDNPDSDENIVITSFPYTDTKDTSNSDRRMFNPTSGVCKPNSGSEAGAEYVYKFTIEGGGTLIADITDEKSGDQIDIDIHLLKEGTKAENCVARDNKKISMHIESGTYYLILDTYTNTDGEKAGEYDLKVEFFDEGSSDLNSFPLNFIPSQSYTSGAARFGANRSGGRLHAAVDLISPKGKPVYAVADGVVLSYRYFYSGTYSVVVDHNDFIVRYGEIKNLANGITLGSSVKKGEVIAYVGLLNSGSSMLHFEMYSGVCKDVNGNTIKIIESDKRGDGLTDRTNDPSNPFRQYERRCDLLNPTSDVKSWESNLPGG